MSLDFKRRNYKTCYNAQNLSQTIMNRFIEKIETIIRGTKYLLGHNYILSSD